MRLGDETAPGVSMARSAPAAGSLSVTAPFTDYRQYVGLVVNVRPPSNLFGKTLHANVRLVSGFFEGHMVMHVASVGSVFAGGVPAFDATKVIVVGVQIATGTAPVKGAIYGNDAAVSAGSPVFEVDTVTD